METLSKRLVMPALWLGFFCLLVAASAFAQRGITVTPDAIFYNGKIITVDSGFSIQQAFAVKGEQYVAVGTNAKIRALAGKGTRMVDLKGSAVMPGLTDNHDHLYNAEKAMRGVDLVGATSTAEVVRRLKEGLAKAKPGETVFGSLGWRAPVTAKDLDQVSTEVPVVAYRGRRGEATMNSVALKKAGITKDMQTYMGKLVPKDRTTGELTGETPGWPAGMYAIDAVVPAPTQLEEERMIMDGQAQRNALGITSIRELASLPPGMRAFDRMERQGRLTVRVSMGLDTPDVNDPGSLMRVQGMTPGFGDHWVRIDSIGEQPWPSNDNPQQAVTLSQEKYTAFVLEMNRLGWREAPHIATNDVLDMTLNSYEAADRESSIHDKRWVIEHIPNVTPTEMDRIAKLNLIISTNMAGYSGNYDNAVRTLGKEQADRQTPVRELLDHHIMVTIGSDYSGPTLDNRNPNNPFVPLYYYISRKAPDGKVIGAQEKISRQEALRIAANNSAFATWEEKDKGSIEPGKLADFLVLSGDIMTIPEDEILKLHPMATYVGGRKVYSAPEAKDAF